MSEYELIYEFHRAGMWTPDEIAETRAHYAHLFRGVGVMSMPEYADVLAREREGLVREVMYQRFEMERRGLWGRSCH